MNISEAIVDEMAGHFLISQSDINEFLVAVFPVLQKKIMPMDTVPNLSNYKDKFDMRL